MEKKKTIRRCQYCGSYYEPKTGLSNLKNLWRKPSWNEWFILIMIAMVIIMAFFYYNEMTSSMYLRNNFDEVCNNYIQNKLQLQNNNNISWSIIDNFSGSIKEATDKINSIGMIPNETSRP